MNESLATRALKVVHCIDYRRTHYNHHTTASIVDRLNTLYNSCNCPKSCLRDMTKVCVCQICTCGRHKCRHNPQGGISFGTGPCSFSEYANTYVQHPIEMRKSCKPEAQAVKGDGLMDDKTTNRMDYIAHPVEKRYVHQGDKYKPPEGSIDMRTSYGQEYTNKPSERVKPMKREDQRKDPAKFDGEPTYAADYRQWGVTPRERFGPVNDYNAPSVPFEGNSNYQSDYLAHSEPKRSSMKPNEKPMISDMPFDDATAYRQSYVQHAITPREVREKPTWQPSTARLDDMSICRQDYTRKEGTKQVSCKPNAAPYQSAEPFDGGTTQRADYIGWPTERVTRHEPEKYAKPAGDFDMNTTSGMDFTRKPLERIAAVRPQNNHAAPGKFDGTTNYQVEYLKWEGTERSRPKKKDPYTPNDAPFEGLGTYTRDYVQHEGTQRTRSLKPIDPGYSSNAPLDDGTEYKKQYTEKKADRCIVPHLDAENAEHGYNFHEEDECGHRWYKLAQQVVAD